MDYSFIVCICFVFSKHLVFPYSQRLCKLTPYIIFFVYLEPVGSPNFLEKCLDLPGVPRALLHLDWLALRPAPQPSSWDQHPRNSLCPSLLLDCKSLSFLLTPSSWGGILQWFPKTGSIRCKIFLYFACLKCLYLTLLFLDSVTGNRNLGLK